MAVHIYDDSAQTLDVAQRNLADLRALAVTHGHACSDVVGPPYAVRFCVGEPGQRRFVMVSVLAFDDGEHRAVLTTPVLKGVHQRRSRVLDLCNVLTRENPAYPCVLHETDEGADLLIKQCYPHDMLCAAPDFFSCKLHSLPSVAAVTRERADEEGISGGAYEWSGADFWRLSTRSMF
jgi:hypothetical protein